MSTTATLACLFSAASSHRSISTGKERDQESGLDYFFARYYSSNFARFLTPDWAAAPTAVPYARFGDPQSLDLYAYLNNNPNAGVDLDGHDGLSNRMPVPGAFDAPGGATGTPMVAIDQGIGGMDAGAGSRDFSAAGEGGNGEDDPISRLFTPGGGSPYRPPDGGVRHDGFPMYIGAPNNGGDYNGNSLNYLKRKPTGQCATILSGYEGAADKVNAKGWVGFWGPTMTGAAAGSGGFLSMGKALLLGILNGAAWSGVTDDSRSQIDSLYSGANAQWQAAGCGSSMYNKYD